MTKPLKNQQPYSWTCSMRQLSLRAAQRQQRQLAPIWKGRSVVLTDSINCRKQKNGTALTRRSGSILRE